MTDTLLTKCAEYGVDPATLVKKADRLIREYLKGIPGEMAAYLLPRTH